VTCTTKPPAIITLPPPRACDTCTELAGGFRGSDEWCRCCEDVCVDDDACYDGNELCETFCGDGVVCRMRSGLPPLSTSSHAATDDEFYGSSTVVIGGSTTTTIDGLPSFADNNTNVCSGDTFFFTN
jgi:hypothetical protein